MITQDRLKELLRYCPATGVFTYAKGRSGKNVKVGDRAGWISDKGYVRVCLDNRTYFAHKLAWLFVYGEYPDRLDHRNRDRSNNSISNLRKASNSQNQMNAASGRNSSGYKGVSWHKHTKKWVARIRKDGKLIALGCFSDPKEAARAYNDAAQKLFGEFALLNRSI